MTLDIDRMLTEDAEEWRSNLPPDNGPEAMLHGTRRPRRSGHWVLAVAGSVAAVLVVVAVVVGMNWSSPPRSTSPATRSFSGPCQDNFVAGPSTYKRSAPPTFENLRVTLSYRGSEPCQVSAYGPYFEMRDASGHLLGIGSHTTLEAVSPDQLTVEPGDSLALAMRWTPLCPSSSRVATVILHLDGNPNTSGIGVRVSVASGYAPACDSHVIAPFVGFVELPHLIAVLTAAQKTLALQIAHQEARGSIPDGSPVTHGMWPLNVDNVSVLVTTATDAAQYVGGSSAATGKVLVIRLTGRFSVATTGPRGHGNAKGNELTVVVSLTAGRISDFGVETHHPAADLPGSTVLFSR